MMITAVEPIVLRADRVDTTRADGTQDAFLVRIHTDEGHVGIGEADTSRYLARTMIEMPSSHLIARGLGEVLVGEDPLQIDRLWHVMYRATYHYGRGGVALHVISAVDMALWDIAGKAAGRPVHDLLGGARLQNVPVYASQVMPDTTDEVRAIAEAADELARDRNADVVPHCFSTGVLVAASLHFAAALERPTWSEYSVTDSPLVSGLLAEPFAFSDGALKVPGEPGLGIGPNEDLLERMRVE